MTREPRSAKMITMGVREGLSDGVVTLSPLELADVDDHLAGEDDELAYWLNGGRGTLATVEAHIHDCVAQWTTGGPVYALGIRTGRGQLAGTVEVQFDRPYLAYDEVNLSYGVYPSWRRQGIATRAVLLACQFAAGMGAVRAVIRADVLNLASAAVAVRSGFVHLKRTLDGDDVLDWFARDLTGQPH
ncbi:MAG TPA: GNAT family N-acetyltransferase [Pseudonocardia sp.]|nr:GNAT family N-acetyltransferase [Pseudonocardia sp.]